MALLLLLNGNDEKLMNFETYDQKLNNLWSQHGRLWFNVLFFIEKIILLISLMTY